MNAKMILAILIVALIGVVAASYHDEVVDGMNMFKQLDDDSNTYVTDEVAASENQISIDESQATPQTSSASQSRIEHVLTTNSIKQSPTVSVSSGPNNFYDAATNNNKVNSQNKTNPDTNHKNSNITNNTPSNDQNRSDDKNNTPSTTISVAQASSIAQSWAKNQGFTGVTTQYVSTDKSADGGTLYTFNIKKGGKIVGTVEIDAKTSKVTGGAILNEAPDVDEKEKKDNITNKTNPDKKDNITNTT